MTADRGGTSERRGVCLGATVLPVVLKLASACQVTNIGDSSQLTFDSVKESQIILQIKISLFIYETDGEATFGHGVMH